MRSTAIVTGDEYGQWGLSRNLHRRSYKLLESSRNPDLLASFGNPGGPRRRDDGLHPVRRVHATVNRAAEPRWVDDAANPPAGQEQGVQNMLLSAPLAWPNPEQNMAGFVVATGLLPAPLPNTPMDRFIQEACLKLSRDPQGNWQATSAKAMINYVRAGFSRSALP